jgi:hypothetical protein
LPGAAEAGITGLLYRGNAQVVADLDATGLP